jgi:Mg2+/Co2+ transporter CorB
MLFVKSAVPITIVMVIARVSTRVRALKSTEEIAFSLRSTLLLCMEIFNFIKINPLCVI